MSGKGRAVVDEVERQVEGLVSAGHRPAQAVLNPMDWYAVAVAMSFKADYGPGGDDGCSFRLLFKDCALTVESSPTVHVGTVYFPAPPDEMENA